jgi:hypothetical protein
VCSWTVRAEPARLFPLLGIANERRSRSLPPCPALFRCLVQSRGNLTATRSVNAPGQFGRLGKPALHGRHIQLDERVDELDGEVEVFGD